MELGKQIKQMREQRHIKVSDFAKQIGVNRMTLHRYETGQTDENMTVDVLDRVAKTLKTTPDMLMGWSNRQTANLVYLINQLDQGQIDWLQAEIRNKLDQKVVSMLSTNQIRTAHKAVIDLYGSVSAGTGQLMQDNRPEPHEVQGKIPNHDYAVKVVGDSMEPLFSDGEVIYVREPNLDGEEPRVGQIVIASVNGEAFVKKLGLDNDQPILISLNQRYGNITINEWDDFRIMGIVVL